MSMYIYPKDITIFYSLNVSAMWVVRDMILNIIKSGRINTFM